MEQHPVPQNVTSYEFRLVGDMTLKQFLELAAGIVLAYIFFASNLIFFIKWPLVIASAFFGVALAFFPIQERPLDQWIINFVKSIYAPTRFIWRRGVTPPKIFQFTRKLDAQSQADQALEKAQKTTPPQTEIVVQEQEMDEGETTRVEHITQLLDQNNPPQQTVTPQAKPAKPNVLVRKLTPQEDTATVIFERPPVRTAPPAEPIESPKHPPAPQPAPQTPQLVDEPSIIKQKVANAAAAQTLDNQIPLTSKDPNIVVGMVTNEQGQLEENAIVEIRDVNGTPQRAVKTNKLGQFFIATPLSNGTYTVHVEKEGLFVPPQQIQAAGQIIPPLKLQAA